MCQFGKNGELGLSSAIDFSVNASKLFRIAALMRSLVAIVGPSSWLVG
jgi:hypothetical protein